VECVLADECEDVIDVPSCHIIGCNDPYIHGAMALFSVCDEDTAVMFDHGKGHTVPRDAQTIRELADVISGLRQKGKECGW
jgi:Serine hydrolase (FSH1).